MAWTKERLPGRGRSAGVYVADVLVVWALAAESRESQAQFCCRACGMVEHADLNAARNILALGLPGR